MIINKKVIWDKGIDHSKGLKAKMDEFRENFFYILEFVYFRQTSQPSALLITISWYPNYHPTVLGNCFLFKHFFERWNDEKTNERLDKYYSCVKKWMEKWRCWS